MKTLIVLAALIAGTANANGSSAVCFVPPDRVLKSENNTRQIFQLSEDEFAKAVQLIRNGATLLDFGERGEFIPILNQRSLLFGRIVGKIESVQTELWLINDSSI